MVFWRVVPFPCIRLPYLTELPPEVICVSDLLWQGTTLGPVCLFSRNETDEKIFIGTGEGGGSGSTGEAAAGEGARRARGSRFQGARL